MANLYIYRIDSTSCRVRVENLDTDYSQGGRWISFDIFRGSSLVGYYTITLDDGVSRSDYVDFKDLIPDTKYVIEATIGGIVGSSNVHLDDYFYTEPPDLVVPSPDIWTTGYDYIEVDWDSTGADYYAFELYKGSSLIERGQTSKLYKKFSGLIPDTLYKVYVYSVIGSLESAAGTDSDYTDAIPYPSFSVYDKDATIIILSISNNFDLDYYDIYVDGTYHGYTDAGSSGSTLYIIDNLAPLTTYGIRLTGKWNGYFSVKSPTLYVATLDSPRPDNWNWEYTIASGQPFYNQVGDNVFLMRAAHWNAFTARINEFRDYKSKLQYTFTTATTSTTEVGIRNCINQAITVINTMGFSQPSISSGDNVAASVFLTMRNNLNSIP